MAIEIIPRRDSSRGVVRFAVRGASFLPLAEAAALREKYNEYPSSFPLFHEFPQPGRRGGSRPPAAVGASGEPGVGEGGAGEVPASMYPVARPRIAIELPVGGVSQLSLGPGAAGDCGRDDGVTFVNRNAVGIGLTVVLVSVEIKRPFIVDHVMFSHGGLVSDDVTFTLKVATDADTSGGTSTTGVPVLTHFGDTPNQMASPQGTLQAFPLRKVTQVPVRLKVVYVNNSAAIALCIVSVSLRYID